MTIPFNKPFIAGKELYYIAQAVTYGNLSGDGYFTEQCSAFLRDTFDTADVLMTPSCTAALEMAAMLCGLTPGDEVIMPSYTFVSTANAFVRAGATPVFVDIRPDTLNLDETLIEDAITDRTRAIVPVHYAGVGCDMERIMSIASTHDLTVCEDAAQAVNARIGDRFLGTIGHLGCYSFHETKNYICGEGGALAINDPQLIERAHILRDKGTNRQTFLRGDIDKYTWVDIGSSYVPSELCCAFLWAQLERLDDISQQREQAYNRYLNALSDLEADNLLQLPHVPIECRSNSHMFYVLVATSETRTSLLQHLTQCGIHSVFHYTPLHSSPAGRRYGSAPQPLPVTDDISARLLRLPLYHDISADEQNRILQEVTSFLRSHSSNRLDSPHTASLQ